MTSGVTRSVETRDGPMDLYEARPSEDARGAVVVIHEAFGLNDYIRRVAGTLAEAGYHAVAPALFHRAGGVTAGYRDFRKAVSLVEGMDDESVLVDVDAALAYLRAAGWSEDRIGIVGFCMGGRVTFLVAARRRLGAAVGFYGGAIVRPQPGRPALVDEASRLQTPWLGLYGDRDSGTSVAELERLRAALRAASVTSEVTVYPGVEHGFHCEDHPTHDAQAAAAAWARTTAWLAEHLGR